MKLYRFDVSTTRAITQYDSHNAAMSRLLHRMV